MTTAQTVQLLDANNNNISPAVCIDSIYYEGTVGSNPYRFALREKFVVGDDLKDGESHITSDGKLLLPYIFAKHAPGNESIWKLSTGDVDITDDVCTFIDYQCDGTYETIANVSNNCVWRDGSRPMTGNLKMADKLTLSQTGIADATGDRLTLENNNATLAGREKVIISAPKVSINSADISIGDTTASTTYVYGKYAAVYSQNDLSIGAHDGELLLNGKQGVNVDSNADIKLNAGSNNAITLDANVIKFNGKKFTPPTASDASHMLSVTQTGDMTWSDIGGMKLLNYNGSEEKVFSFVETAEQNVLKGTNISFAGGSSHAVIGGSELGDITIASVGGQTLDSSSDIKFKTIKTGESTTHELVGAGEIELIDKATFDAFKPTVAYKGDESESGNVCTMLTNSDGTVKINQSSQVTLNNGSVQAKTFIMSSDRNLKTDIRENCFALEMPPIHGFKWIDSSIQSYGFIAQELEEAGFEHLVTERNGIKGVDYMAALSYKVAQLERENKMLAQSLVNLYEKLNIK